MIVAQVHVHVHVGFSVYRFVYLCCHVIHQLSRNPAVVASFAIRAATLRRLNAIRHCTRLAHLGASTSPFFYRNKSCKASQFAISTLYVPLLLEARPRCRLCLALSTCQLHQKLISFHFICSQFLLFCFSCRFCRFVAPNATRPWKQIMAGLLHKYSFS